MYHLRQGHAAVEESKNNLIQRRTEGEEHQALPFNFSAGRKSITMIYEPQKYAIPDEPMKPFISEEEIWDIIHAAEPTKDEVRAIISKSLGKKRLSLQETALLINTTDPELVEEIKAGARRLKEMVYGNRIVLFAPLYVGNLCTNNCQYCGFRTSNKHQKRTTLTMDDLVQEVEQLEDSGQKRLILVYGEHPRYTPEFIADTVRTVYKVKKGHGVGGRYRNLPGIPGDLSSGSL